MKTIQYRTVDKSDWGEGPWQHEPDKVQWQDEATGLPCLIVRGPSGGLCGYVGVSPGHRYYGVDYGDIAVRVHGGLTFAGACQGKEYESRGVCHVPGEGDPDHVYWLGFDCAHAGDLSPAHANVLAAFGLATFTTDDQYRNIDYVKAEVAQMAQQLIEDTHETD